MDSFISEDEEVNVRKKGIFVLEAFYLVAEVAKGPLFRVRFWRVVLDEAHIIRNRTTKAAKAVWDLDSIHRWSLTGTLIVNRYQRTRCCF